MVLRGVPKAMADRISEVILEVSPANQIVRLVIQATDGSTTDFRFSRIEENVAVPDGFFHFVPPPGVVTIPDEQTGQ